MPKVVIAGAGLAGLSAAVELASNGYIVDLYESSKKGGGRAYSFPNVFPSNPGSYSKFTIDNGQHIMMGCYKNTLSFLEKTDSINKLSIQEKLCVKYYDRVGNLYSLKSGILPYPINLLQAISGYNFLSFRQKVKAILFIRKLFFLETTTLNSMTVSDWLKREGQTDELLKGVWEILCVGAMNSPLEKTSASSFATVLKEIFLRGRNNANIIIPKCGLSELFVDGGVKFIKESGGSINFSNPLEKIEFAEGKVTKIKFREGEIENPENVILALPHHAIKKITGIQDILGKVVEREMEYSSITTFHLLLKINPLKDEFLALINSPVQWVFNHGDYITTVTSSSNEWNAKEESEILKIVLDELEWYLGIQKSDVISHKMIKEKRATFICGGDNLGIRMPSLTPIQNLFLAGDWTDTGLPATIEGAILSGITAANLIISQNRV